MLPSSNISLILLFLTILFLNSSYGSQKTKELDERRKEGSVTTKIVGGAVVNPPFKYPWIVGLFEGGLTSVDHFCGGSVIDDTHILTAAHCTVGIPKTGIFVQVHRHDLTESPENEDAQIRSVIKMIVHPFYEENSEGTPLNDIAIWTLDSPLDSVVPIELDWDGLDYSDPGTPARIMGWGRIDSDGPSSPFLLHTNVSLISNYQCSLDYDELFPPTMLCAGTPEGGKDACQGDSDKFLS